MWEKPVRHLLAALTSFALVFCLGSIGNAQVYKTVDKDGNVQYSSTPPAKGAKPADLPKIMRAEVKLTEKRLETCDKHGGVNCQAGADADGSVICYDGFTEASTRFRFSCSTAKLEISDVSDLTKSGGFTVFVRNSKSVKAAEAALIFKPNGGQEIKLNGPTEVEPFGVAEFVYEPPKGKEESLALAKPTLAELDLMCANCS
ncbi:MAG: hypothetical protein RL417_590 [Pseudomonadota bacterium]|jgi:hypothetical protein